MPSYRVLSIDAILRDWPIVKHRLVNPKTTEKRPGDYMLITSGTIKHRVFMRVLQLSSYSCKESQKLRFSVRRVTRHQRNFSSSDRSNPINAFPYVSYMTRDDTRIISRVSDVLAEMLTQKIL